MIEETSSSMTLTLRDGDSMWQTDTVTLQTKSETNVLGSIKVTWTPSTSVTCDVQDISKEIAYKEYGLVDNVIYKQIYDHTLANWKVGYQVSYLGEQWLIRHVNACLHKMALTDHTHVIISKVIK